VLVALQEDLTLVSAATSVATTLNCVSPGLAQVGGLENFEAVGAFGRLVLTVCMLLGRLVKHSPLWQYSHPHSGGTESSQRASFWHYASCQR